LTEDSVLAYALYLAFSPFSADEMPCVNYYTLDKLRELGYKGMLPQEAAVKAVREGKKGTVNYMFRLPEGELLTAYHDQKKVIEDGSGEARDVIKNLLEDYRLGARSYNETILRVACTILYMRAEFLKIWRTLEPLLRIDDLAVQKEEKRPDGSRVITFGGLKFVSANASEKTRERLGV
jgi:hypothetical protein